MFQTMSKTRIACTKYDILWVSLNRLAHCYVLYTWQYNAVACPAGVLITLKVEIIFLVEHQYSNQSQGVNHKSHNRKKN